MQHTTFLALIIAYQLTLTARDFTVTGLLAKGAPPDWKFHIYCIATTLEAAILATLAAFTEPNTLTAALKAWTVMLCWTGGALDWIYFGLAKLAKTLTGREVPEIPEWEGKWFWMPKIFPYITRGRISFSHPTTKHWAAYTALMCTPNLICWTLILT